MRQVQHRVVDPHADQHRPDHGRRRRDRTADQRPGREAVKHAKADRHERHRERPHAAAVSDHEHQLHQHDGGDDALGHVAADGGRVEGGDGRAAGHVNGQPGGVGRVRRRRDRVNQLSVGDGVAQLRVADDADEQAAAVRRQHRAAAPGHRPAGGHRVGQQLVQAQRVAEQRRRDRPRRRPRGGQHGLVLPQLGRHAGGRQPSPRLGEAGVAQVVDRRPGRRRARRTAGPARPGGR